MLCMVQAMLEAVYAIWVCFWLQYMYSNELIAKSLFLKVTLNSCAHAHSIRHEYNYFCIAGNCNGVRGSVVFWCAKLCKERQ